MILNTINNIWYRGRMPFIALFVMAFVSVAACSNDSDRDSDRPNFLFIAVDDLRPEIAAFGAAHMKTPSLDQLANEGRAFTHHYVQVPSCGPSRYTLLTGRVPQSTAYSDNNDIFFRDELPTSDAPYESFAHLLKENGYRTISLGKISHHPDGRMFGYDESGDGRLEMPQSWDAVWGPTGDWKFGWDAFFGYAGGKSRAKQGKANSAPVEAAEGDDLTYADGHIAAKAIEQIGLLADSSEPFLLAVGFFKPHLPFTAPQSYWDLYDRDRLPLSPNPQPPADYASRPTTLHDNGEFHIYGTAREHPTLANQVSEDYARELRHAYFASVSYVDAQIGKVLQELARSGLDKNTVVILWGDHGWHLGDHGVWGKHTLQERALLSPLIVRVPGMSSPGAPTDAIIETLDIYPTIAELAGIDAPQGLAGTSLLPQLRDATLASGRYARGYFRGDVTLRSPNYRAIAYAEASAEHVEVFDHRSDPAEITDIAQDLPAGAESVVEDALKHLMQHRGP
jgi:arylsulfatase A-like enzyme